MHNSPACFDDRSRRTGLTYTNGASAAYNYDTASRLSYIDNQTGNGQHKYSYMYDNVGNRWSMMITDSGGVRTHVYSYDNIYQITDVNYPASLSYLATDTTFTYDDAGNRSSVIDGSGTCSYTSNNLNQYTAAGTTSFQYDDSGNMTQDGQYTYTYDPENRLTQVQKPNPPTQQLNSFAAYTKGGDAVWVADGSGFAKSGNIDDEQESWMYIDVSGPGTVQFQWKVSSQQWDDCLKFTVDGVNRGEISGERSWQQETYTLTGTGSHRLQWRYYKDSSEYEGDDCGYVKAVTFTPPALPAPDYLAQAVDSELAFTTGGLGLWWRQTGSPSYYDGDCAQSGGTNDDDESWMQTTVAGAGTVTFWWKVSSESGCDCLEFYLDGQLQSNPISGEVAWQQRSYPITTSGPHTLRWRYVKDGSSSFGDDCGWVDWVQWSGPLPEPGADAWATLNYLYDAGGRRIEKRCDGRTITKYVYDGDHCIAEYDAGNTLRRKYIYGPCVDEPICLIEATQSYAGTYYYHFDALGSCVALTNSSGNTVEVYEYDVYGRVGASDANHPNRLMFTGREYDKETGLYYYRARYYNPQIGRFLQTDPVGYGAGMNLYAYCGSSPTGRTDPSGLWASYTFEWITNGTQLRVNCYEVDGTLARDPSFTGWADLLDYVNHSGKYAADSRPGDFCDVNFDRAAFMAVLNAALTADPSYGMGGSGVPGIAGAVGTVLAGATPGYSTAPDGLLEYAQYGSSGPAFPASPPPNWLQKLVGAVRGAVRALTGTTTSAVVKVGKYTYTATEAEHLYQRYGDGGWLRPYMRSELFIDELLAAGRGKGIPDPGGIAGAIRYVVSGSYGGTDGTYEIVIDPVTNTIYHYLFTSKVVPQ